MDKENWKQTSNVLHYLLLHPNPSPLDTFFFLANSLPFPHHDHGYPLFGNYYLHAFKTKASNFFDKICRYRPPGNKVPSLGPRFEARYRMMISAEEAYVTSMLPLERRRKPPIFGRPPTWAFMIPNIIVLLLFYYKIYEPPR